MCLLHAQETKGVQGWVIRVTVRLRVRVQVRVR